MADPAPSNNPNPNPPADPNNPNPAPNPDPNNPAPAADPKPNDPGTVQLTPEQLQAAFQHPRFKELAAQAAKAKQLEDAQRQAEEDRAKQNGEFEKLAESAKSEAEKYKTQYETAVTNNAIIAAAVKAGVTDADAAIKLIDRGSIKLNDDGTVEGVEDAVKSLVDSKPYLKGAAPNVNIGGPSNPDPNGPGTPPAYTGSQVRDHKFYMEHQAEIDKAVNEGRVDWSK